MRTPFEYPRRLLAWVRRPQLDRELEEEMRFHLEMRTQEGVEAGLSPEEARHAARRRFGNVTLHKEESREMWGFTAIENLAQDLRYGARMLRRKPGFTLAATLVLALGIGANTAVFSVLNTALFGWMEAYPEPDRLVMVWQTREAQRWTPTPADFRDWRDQNAVFASIAAYAYDSFTVAGAGEPERVVGASVSPALFTVVRVEPRIGRAFAADEDIWGRHRVVLLSHGLWVRRFGGDAGVVGRAIVVNGEPHTVLGVMPPGAWFANTRAELWVPLAFAPDDPSNDRNSHFIYVVARLRPGVSLERATGDMATIARRLEAQYPANQGMGAAVTGLRETILGDVEPAFFVLSGAVAFVLLIACANVANLLLARGATRERELAIRTTLGAGRGRLIRQLLTESLLLAVLGGGLGIGLAALASGLATDLLPTDLPRVHETGFSLDGRVLLFTFGIALLTGLIFGMAPAIHASRLQVSASLKEGGRGATGGARARRVRDVLVVAEIALALVLLTGAGLLIRSFARLQHADIGVRPEGVLTMRIPLPRQIADEPARVIGVFEQIVDALKALPGVQQAGVTSHLPLAGGGQAKYFTVEGRRPFTRLDEVPIVSARQEGPESLKTLGARLLRGRHFDDRDIVGQKVAILNETAMRQFFPGEDPIGKVITLEPPEAIAPPGYLPESGRFTRWTIIGVVGDIAYRGVQTRPEAVVHIPYKQRTDNDQMGWAPEFIVIRAGGDPLALVAAARAQVRRILPDQPVSEVRTLEQVIGRSLRQPRFTMLLLGAFALVALLLAAVGVYGVMAFSVTQRTHEIGIRMALGASRGDVIRLVLRETMWLDALGVGIGLAAALALTRLMSSLLYGVTPTDPLAFATGIALLAGVAFLAAIVPVRRAVSVDPMGALRAE